MAVVSVRFAHVRLPLQFAGLSWFAWLSNSIAQPFAREQRVLKIRLPSQLLLLLLLLLLLVAVVVLVAAHHWVRADRWVCRVLLRLLCNWRKTRRAMAAFDLPRTSNNPQG